MKNLDETTIGGRIRTCRINAAKSLKEFAGLVNVSPNHLGLVERGEKNASMVLLKKVAEIAGVSYKWLNTGETEQPEVSGGEAFNMKDVPAAYTANVNPQLVLALALRSPTFNKETLATFLMVPTETIDGILAGERVDYNPQWGNIFPVLVHGLDIQAVRQELRTLDAFLAKEQENMGRMKLLQSLQKFANEKPATEERPKQEYRIAGGVENRIEAYDTESGEGLSVTTSRMMLDGEGTPNWKWYFAYYPFEDSVSKDTIEEVFEDEVGVSEKAADIGSASIVTGSRTVFEKFCAVAEAHVECCNGRWMHDPSGRVGNPAFAKFFSIILIDADTMNVVDEMECEDAEYEAAMKEVYEQEYKG